MLSILKLRGGGLKFFSSPLLRHESRCTVPFVGGRPWVERTAAVFAARSQSQHWEYTVYMLEIVSTEWNSIPTLRSLRTDKQRDWWSFNNVQWSPPTLPDPFGFCQDVCFNLIKLISSIFCLISSSYGPLFIRELGWHKLCTTFFCCGCLCGRSMSLLTAGLAPVDLTYKLLVALQHRLDSPTRDWGWGKEGDS